MRQAAEGRVESNAVQMLTGGLKSYLTSGDGSVPAEYISSVRDYLGKNLGVSSQRFDELTFEAAKSLGSCPLPSSAPTLTISRINNE